MGNFDDSTLASLMAEILDPALRRNVLRLSLAAAPPDRIHSCAFRSRLSHHLKHQRVVLPAARANGVDFFQHTIARTQKPQASHQRHVCGTKAADRKHPKASGSKYGKQGTVFEFSDDVGPQSQHIEPAVQTGPKRRVPCRKQYGQSCQRMRKLRHCGLVHQG